MQKKLTERTWNSLTQVKDYLESNTKEKIEYFDGATLVTNKNTYGLAFGKLNIKKHDK